MSWAQLGWKSGTCSDVPDLSKPPTSMMEKVSPFEHGSASVAHLAKEASLNAAYLTALRHGIFTVAETDGAGAVDEMVDREIVRWETSCCREGLRRVDTSDSM